MSQATFALGTAAFPNYATVTVTEIDDDAIGGTGQDLKFEITIDTSRYLGDILGVFFDLPLSYAAGSISVYDSAKTLVQTNPSDGILPWLLSIGGSGNINMDGSYAGYFDDAGDLAVRVGTQGSEAGYVTSTTLYLSSGSTDLKLSDFSGSNYLGLRVQSVNYLDNPLPENTSLKIVGDIPDQPALFGISGTKYLDANGDGSTAGDKGLDGVTVYIEKDGVAGLSAGDLSTVTHDGGQWSFTGLDASYAGKQVQELLPSGYVQTLGAAGYTISGTSGTDQSGLDFANHKFVEDRHGLTKGFWGQHLEAWDGAVAINKQGVKDTQNLVTSGVLGKYDVLPDSLDSTPTQDWNGDGSTNGADRGILLGDANGNGLVDSGENTLWVSLTAAQQIINSSDSATDSRQILMSQALAAQLNIYNGDADPLDLVGEAVSWLKGQGPYQYSDGSGGKVDTDQDGILEASEYSTVSKSFIFDANGSTRSGTALTSNLQAWQKDVDVFDLNDGNPLTTSDVVMANGQDLKNALESFNQDKLVTDSAGFVGWNNGGSVEFIHANVMDNFWLTLKDAAVV